MRLYVNDIELHLPPNFKIARTKQVNDIVTLDNRQSDFSQRIKLPRTIQNENALEQLGFNGDTTNIAYSLNRARLLNESGVSEIQDGRLVIFETFDDYYSVALYDGYVNFLKEIENISLTDAGLSELNHLKNIANIKATWDSDLNYRYLLADYNGKMIYDTDRINVDYLIPAVKKSYLFDKVFEYAGWTYSGSVFADEDWTNNLMTYPKAIGDGTQVLTPVVEWLFRGSPNYHAGNFGPGGSPVYYWSNRIHHSPLVNNAYMLYQSGSGSFPEPDGWAIECKTTGLYKLTFDGNFSIDGGSPSGPLSLIMETTDIDGNPIQTPVLQNYTQGDTLNPADHYAYINLREDQIFSIRFYTEFGFPVNVTTRVVGSCDIQCSIVEGDAVDFEEALIDFDMKDFLDELLWEFALTPFVDSANKHIEFLTANEWLLTNEDKVDWSSDKGKFIKKKSEKYIFGSYAKQNYFRHKYNEDNADYNDGALQVVNANLKDKADSVKSRIYTVEKKSSFLNALVVDVYKFWNKEVKDDGSVEYKDLENRFYFQRSVQGSGLINIGSETQGTTDSTSTWYYAKHTNFRWSNIILNRYASLYGILNTQRIVEAEVYLSDQDFADLDFKKLYFIKELGSYFILNKVPNFIKGGAQSVELVEVDLGVVSSTGEAQDPPQITLFSSLLEPDGLTRFNYGILNKTSFYNYEPDSATITGVQLDASPIEGGVPTGFEFSSAFTFPPLEENEIIFEGSNPLDTEEGWYLIQVEDNFGNLSNEQLIYLGDNTPPASPSVTATWIFDSVADGKATIMIVYLDFTEEPTFANFEFQKYDYLTQTPSGPLQTLSLPTTPINTGIPMFIDFGGTGYYKFQVKTNVADSTLNSAFIL